jgi:hypothetical protein
MSNIHKLIIISSDNKLTQTIIRTGTENEFFFSDESIFGNINLAVTKFIEQMNDSELMKKVSAYQQGIMLKKEDDIEDNVLAPVFYGITVINMINQKIDFMGFQDPPGSINTSLFHHYLAKMNASSINDRIIDYTEKNLLKLLNQNTQERYSIKEFFGTTNRQEICLYLASKSARKSAFGIIKKVKNLADFSIIPHNLNNTLTYYRREDADKLFKSLSHTIEFKEQDIQAWSNYLDAYGSDTAIINKIRDYVKLCHEKKHLENITSSVSDVIQEKKNKL